MVNRQILTAFHGDNRQILTISKITDGRKGTIYASNKDNSIILIFDIRGFKRGEDAWQTTYISPTTQSDVDYIKFKNIKSKLLKKDWSKLTQEQLYKLYDFMKENNLI